MTTGLTIRATTLVCICSGGRVVRIMRMHVPNCAKSFCAESAQFQIAQSQVCANSSLRYMTFRLTLRDMARFRNCAICVQFQVARCRANSKLHCANAKRHGVNASTARTRNFVAEKRNCIGKSRNCIAQTRNSIAKTGNCVAQTQNFITQT